MQQKIYIALCTIGIFGLIWLIVSTDGGARIPADPSRPSVETVRVENGVQVIHVIARGGYTPNEVIAKAGTPTKLEVETKGTYDCSAAFTIPSLGVRKMLPATGVTVFDLPLLPVGSSITALCSMGMYSLQIQFN
ncbi:MAG: hypothetical protein A2845_05190 [Candidatus Lloydbacteria bacterium RIFCSPHIGHO2_01_FULL_49_22]|uniref:EfeO-type cupredoxin-like domain-containing protein n=1 Tax=Candidatus Lloydbacteria bacterium RIFCSPHIGHO2_01_FULL_49_22 TaxID=1798658 RepID=A0A1G2CWJ0_9BACT|nr:MAG: hypothetical protein A2845_05190 [Candidatus Lloydbacteria bacterium RIFCSPHIGHO2_01_FULL_49_22]OGZ09523.1 MAG: hypothetical protein A3C14_01745 [Candidatus Lloydbacteria bacterium RIFCSPHIGHO2_02_FULL_50_18]